MAVHKYKSPTGEDIVMIRELVPASASISGIDDEGVPVYSGNSFVHWDDQSPIERNGSFIYEDEDGKEYTFDQLIKDEEIPGGPEEEEQVQVPITAMERDMILAALRLWIDIVNDGGGEYLNDMLIGIATNGDRHPMMDDQAIDELCRRMNP